MKIMSLRNGDGSVNNSSCGLVVYRITTIPSWHNFHIKETQLDILYICYRDFSVKIQSENNSENTIFIFTVCKIRTFYVYEFSAESLAQNV